MLIASQDESVMLPYALTGFEITRRNTEENQEVYVHGLFNEHKYTMARYPSQKEAVKQIKSIAEIAGDKNNCVYMKFQ